MRICILTRALPVHSLGGMETNSFKLAMMLQKMNNEVVMLTTAHPDFPLQNRVEQVSDHFCIHFIGNCLPGQYSSSWYKQTTFVFDDLMNNAPFDILHSHNSAALQLHREKILQRWSIPYVVTWHGTHWDWLKTSLNEIVYSSHFSEIPYLFKVLKRWLFQDYLFTHRAACAIAIDAEMIPKLKFQYGLSQEQICMIPTGIDTELFHPSDIEKARKRLGLPVDQKILLGVGRLINEKGFHYSIEALSVVLRKDPDVMLLLVGDGAEKERLQQLAKRLQIKEKVRFVGRIAHEECPIYYQACDLFINPGVQVSGFNTTIGEAMACEKVVITSRLGGVSTLVNHGENGVLIAPGSVGPLVDAIIQWLNKPVAYRKIASQARQTIERTFSWEKIAARTQVLFENIKDK